MKIISATVNWYKGYANSPRFDVLVDKYPRRNELAYVNKDWAYWAEKDGFVDYFSYSGPSSGFGGCEFELNMVDGSTKTLKGPWSSRASALNLEGFYPCSEVSIGEVGGYYTSGNLIVDKLFDCADLANVYLVLEILCNSSDAEKLMSVYQQHAINFDKNPNIGITRDNWKQLTAPLVGKYEFRFNPSIDPNILVKE